MSKVLYEQCSGSLHLLLRNTRLSQNTAGDIELLPKSLESMEVTGFAPTQIINFLEYLQDVDTLELMLRLGAEEKPEGAYLTVFDAQKLRWNEEGAYLIGAIGDEVAQLTQEQVNILLFLHL